MLHTVATDVRRTEITCTSLSDILGKPQQTFLPNNKFGGLIFRALYVGQMD